MSFVAEEPDPETPAHRSLCRHPNRADASPRRALLDEFSPMRDVDRLIAPSTPASTIHGCRAASPMLRSREAGQVSSDRRRFRFTWGGGLRFRS